MKSRPLQSVTTLPILVDATLEQAEGVYLLPTGTTKNVRVLRRDEERTSHKNKEALDKHYALTKLRSAAIGKNAEDLREAAEELQQWRWRPTAHFKVTENWADARVMQHTARLIFSELMSGALANARLVMWWPATGRTLFLSPAIYCPDLDTALFARFALQGYRLCKKCKTPFYPMPPQRLYCQPSHGVAYRTQKSRKRPRQRDV